MSSMQVLARTGQRAICFRSIKRTVTRPTATRFNSSVTSRQRPAFNHTSTFTYVSSPSPGWQLGDGPGRNALKEDKDSHSSQRKTWDLANSDNMRDAYRLLTSAIVPRPIAFVSTLSEDGQPNLAPFSYFSMVSHNPPMISISCSLSKRRPKDTRENILATKEFTVNIVTEAIAEAANSTSVESPASTDEWIISGLSQEQSAQVKPALVRESPIGMECELHSYQDISPSTSSEPTTTVVLGLIKRVHVHESVLNEDGETVDPSKLRPIARLGGTTYSRLLEGFDLPRVSWRAIAEKYDGLSVRLR